ncbi:homoserine O-acetyltransferase [Bernardetia litoralis DSM 6794]|uniref:Homoserine O-acetyltransferase n=1 Tax=Bernardetia litoralis (strain ATCC 23117 / DSM 6794 / NBRC 15988 / NCIMB 1366 / Fx l1 / Sio-4) TaxID=880071 RepID=I4AP79_BERLS|nr:homoserine O-acetyltransferase [Bernardetia litoralis]AFM05764.1 homoserine O-acetyltransferase [Bernardetia litoralis DSM 6794]
MLNYFNSDSEFVLESGQSLPSLQLAYHTFGKLNDKKDNIVWICHALTANSNPLEWWDILIGENKIINPEKHFIICVNSLGSCYGSTNALSENPKTGQAFYHDFPFFTIRDIASAIDLVRKELQSKLGFEKIWLCVGGSMGGQQAMEWAIKEPYLIENLALIATNARHSAWGIAFNSSQRQAIENDSTWKESNPKAGINGMKVARSIALLSYRNYEAYNLTQTNQDERTQNFDAESYQKYQGEKLAQRFDAFAYYNLSKAMDSHNVGRNRGGIENALSQIKAKTLIVSITNDVLFPPEDQQILAKYIPNSTYFEIKSPYGHDGFLLEGKKLSEILEREVTSRIQATKDAIINTK